MSKNLADARSQLERLSFYLGDWRGEGEMWFGGQPVHFEQRRRCKMTADGSRLEVLAFTDNPETEEMFNGEHCFIFVDNSNGELRLRRQWFLDSGFAETMEAVKVAEDGESAKFEVTAGGETPPVQGQARQKGREEVISSRRQTAAAGLACYTGPDAGAAFAFLNT